MSRIIIIGECRLDVAYPASFGSGATVRPSGLMAEIALRLAADGYNTLFLTEVANDSVGTSIIDYLNSHGVDTSCADRFTDGLTPMAVRRSDGTPTLYTAFPPTDGFDIIWPRLDDKEDIVIFGDYMTLSRRWNHNFTNFMHHVASKGCPTIYVPGDIAWREPRVTKVMPQVFENLEMATAVMLDPATCAYYFGTDDPAKALKQTVDYYCRSILFRAEPSGSVEAVGVPVDPALLALARNF